MMGRTLLLLLLFASSLAAEPLEEADHLFRQGRFADAAAAFRALVGQDTRNEKAQAGLVRSLLKADEIKAARAAAVAAHQAIVTSAPLRALAGDVFFRQGEFENARRFYLSAVQADPKCARGYWGMGRLYQTEFRRRTARETFQKAYALEPNDPDILLSYAGTLDSGAEQAQLYEKYLTLAPNEDADRLKGIREDLRCREHILPEERITLLSPYQPYRLPLQPLRSGPQHPVRGVTIIAKLNGSRTVRLHLDTGASGLLLNRKAAEKAGVVPRCEMAVYGIGDKGARSSQYSTLDRLEFGALALGSFPVQLMEQATLGDADGLMGTDVFARFLVSLDLPGGTLSLAPLPGEDGTSRSWKDHDRTMPPGQEAFSPVRHWGHQLLVPTTANGKKTGHFILDTGASMNLIAEEFAREVGSVGRDQSTILKGLSGRVDKVYSTGSVRLQFGRFVQDNSDMIAISLREMNCKSGMEIAGLLGWPILSQLVLSINYRDGLMELVYDPRRR